MNMILHWFETRSNASKLEGRGKVPSWPPFLLSGVRFSSGTVPVCAHSQHACNIGAGPTIHVRSHRAGPFAELSRIFIGVFVVFSIVVPFFIVAGCRGGLQPAQVYVGRTMVEHLAIVIRKKVYPLRGQIQVIEGGQPEGFLRLFIVIVIIVPVVRAAHNEKRAQQQHDNTGA